jgi:hypothetical protein
MQLCIAPAPRNTDWKDISVLAISVRHPFLFRYPPPELDVHLFSELTPNDVAALDEAGMQRAGRITLEIFFHRLLVACFAAAVLYWVYSW